MHDDAMPHDRPASQESTRRFVKTPAVKETVGMMLEQGAVNDLDTKQMLNIHGRILLLLAESSDELISALNKTTAASRQVQEEANRLAQTLAPFSKWTTRVGLVVVVCVLLCVLWVIGKVTGDTTAFRALVRLIGGG